MFPRYFSNRIGFAPTTDGKVIFMVRVDGPREAWTLFTDGTQRRIEAEDHVEDWYHRMAEDPNQPMEEVRGRMRYGWLNRIGSKIGDAKPFTATSMVRRA